MPACVVWQPQNLNNVCIYMFVGSSEKFCARFAERDHRRAGYTASVVELQGSHFWV